MMTTWVKPPDRLQRFWKRFLDYAKVGVCIALILFLFQNITFGAGVPDVMNLLSRAGILLAVAIGGAAGVAAAHEFRRGRLRAVKRSRLP